MALVFKLPEGVTLYAPIDGVVLKVKLPNGGGSQLIIRNSNDPTTITYGITGDIKDEGSNSIQVKKGDPIGHIQNSGLKLPLGDYNISINATRSENNGLIQATDALKLLFPTAFKKGPVGQFSASGTTVVVAPPKYGN